MNTVKKKIGARNQTEKLKIEAPKIEVGYFLVADVNNGVKYIKYGDDYDLEDLREFYQAKDGEDFYDALPICGDDQVIICRNVSDEWRKKIKDEYGIN